MTRGAASSMAPGGGCPSRPVFWVESRLAGHLNLRMRQVVPPAPIDPGLHLLIRLFHGRLALPASEPENLVLVFAVSLVVTRLQQRFVGRLGNLLVFGAG